MFEIYLTAAREIYLWSNSDANCTTAKDPKMNLNYDVWTIPSLYHEFPSPEALEWMLQRRRRVITSPQDQNVTTALASLGQSCGAVGHAFPRAEGHEFDRTPPPRTAK